MDDETTAEIEERDLATALQRVIEIAAGDEDGRRALLQIADAIVATVDAAAPAESDDEQAIVPMDRAAFVALVDKAIARDSVANDQPAAPRMRNAADAREGVSDAPAPMLDRSGHPDDGLAEAREDRDSGLPGLAERTRLKGRLTHAIAVAMEDGTAVDEALVHRARSSGASTWMIDVVDPDREHLLQLADCFIAVAEAVELVAFLRADPAAGGHVVEALGQLAAVQSALRVATARFRQTPDEDQLAAFGWLRQTTSEERIFVERHMRLDDPLDPSDVDPIVEAISDQLDDYRLRTQQGGIRKKALSRIRYHASRIAKGSGTDHDRQRIAEAVADAVADGLPPSNLELRAMLEPIRGDLPDAVDGHEGYARVIADIDGYRAQREERAGPPAAHEKPQSPEVLAVAELMRRKEMVIIGGERRVEAEAAMKDAFELAELHWFTLSDDPSVAEIERTISREDVALVVQLIRWSRHRFGEAKDAADANDKPFVRVKAGYNPSAVAHAVLEQASERLRARGS